MAKKTIGKRENQSARRFTYLLSEPFPMEKITLGITKRRVLDFIYKGENPHSISKVLGIARSTTIQHLEELRKKGLVRKGIKDEAKYGDAWAITEKGIFLIEKTIGFPAKSTRVTLSQSAKHLPPNFNRGHAIQFKIRTPKTFNSLSNEEKIRLLKKSGIESKSLNLFGGGQGIVFYDKKVHLTASSVIIYDSESYFAPTAVKSEDNAMVKVLYLIRNLEKALGLALSIEGKYVVRITKRHHALIKNEIAEIYNKPKRTKLDVYSEKGLWLLIDNSWNLGELECVHSTTAVPDADGMRRVLNSYKETDFKYTSKLIEQNFQETDERIKKISEQSVQLSQVLEQMNNNIIKVTKLVMDNDKGKYK